MSERKPVIIAIAVGSLALAANGAAAVVAISASSAPPQAAAFGVIGLTAAFVGLIATIIWAFHDEPQAPSIRHQRVFTPWSERAEEEFAPLAGRSALALARFPMLAQAPAEETAPSEGTVIYIAEWLKARAPVNA
jgi:hypothetical protein